MLTIKRTKASRPFKFGKQSLVAYAMADGARSSSGQYQHPTIEIGYMLHFLCDEPRFERMATITFQRNRIGAHDSYSGPEPRGLLSIKGWSGCYGETLSFDVMYARDRAAGRRVLDLLDRLDEQEHERYRVRPIKAREALSCRMLAVIVGLRHAGVPVEVSRPTPARRDVGRYGSLAVSR